MKYSIEKHALGYCLVKPNGDTISTGEPHMRSTLYFKSKKEVQAMVNSLSDTMDNVKLEAYISSQIIEAFEHVTRSEISFNDLQDIAGGIAHKITLKIEGKL